MRPTSTIARIRANRQNALLSTGPRSEAGKKRVARNALRHGLAVPISAFAEFVPAVDQLARAIAGSDASAVRLNLARDVAEAHLEVCRARRAQADLIAATFDPGGRDDTETEAPNSPVQDVERGVRRFNGPMVTEPQDLSVQLLRLYRYEQRAMARRKTAIRSLEALPSELDKGLS